jgi:hypothetical protein
MRDLRSFFEHPLLDVARPARGRRNAGRRSPSPMRTMVCRPERASCMRPSRAPKAPRSSRA